jgi:hypothetical protein
MEIESDGFGEFCKVLNGLEKRDSLKGEISNETTS